MSSCDLPTCVYGAANGCSAEINALRAQVACINTAREQLPSESEVEPEECRPTSRPDHVTAFPDPRIRIPAGIGVQCGLRLHPSCLRRPDQVRRLPFRHGPPHKMQGRVSANSCLALLRPRLLLHNVKPVERTQLPCRPSCRSLFQPRSLFSGFPDRASRSDLQVRGQRRLPREGQEGLDPRRQDCLPRIYHHDASLRPVVLLACM